MNTPNSIYSKTVEIALDALASKDRRIAELEAALKNFYAGHQGCSDPERDDCQCRDCLAYRAYKVDNTPVLDAALAAAKREALEAAADRAEETTGVLTDEELRRMAREVKP